MAILNKRLLLVVAIKVIIKRRRRRRYGFQDVRRRFWVNVFREPDRGNAKRRDGDVFQVKNNSLTSDY